jgi:hypothetical protein
MFALFKKSSTILEYTHIFLFKFFQQVSLEYILLSRQVSKKKVSGIMKQYRV